MSRIANAVQVTLDGLRSAKSKPKSKSLNSRDMSLRDTRGQDRGVLDGQPQRVDHNHPTALPAL
ncbi:MAG: hypothetical protein AB2993_07660 (plasmid) [Candidatus Symbiodolus clandestinus]